MSKQLPSYVGLAVLFVVSFLLFGWVYDYVIVFQSESNDCFFMFGRPFLKTFLDRPGGVLRYAGRFLGQFYYYKWLGALIVSASIACFGVLFHHVLARFKRPVPVSHVILPCILLLALHTSVIWLRHSTLGLCVSCGAFLGYLSLPGKAWRRAFALAAAPVIYLLLGAHVWLFAAWVVAFEWRDGPRRSGRLFGIAYAIFVMTLPLVAWRWVFPISLRGALTSRIIPVEHLHYGMVECSVTQVVVVCFLALLLLACLLLMPFERGLMSGSRPAPPWRTGRDWRRRIARAVAIPVFGVLILVVQYDGHLSTLVGYRRLYGEKQWDAFLEKAKRESPEDLRVQVMTNFSLQKKRRLLDEMFRYPQPWGTRGLLLNFTGKNDLSRDEQDDLRAMYNCDLFYEMGHVNAALRHAYADLHVWRETYDALKRMAQCSMVNGNYAMATKYLNILERTLFHRDFARRYKAIIADPRAAEEEFGDLRRRLPVVETPLHDRPSLLLFALLDARPDNRMAFDYLMAWMLLDRKMDSIGTVCASMEHMRRAGYDSIPAHCQEALLLWERANRGRVDLRGFRYDEAIAARMERFFHDLSQVERRPDAATCLQTSYGDTYAFYYFFAAPPPQTRRYMPPRGGLVGGSRQE